MVQVLHMSNGESINGKLTADGNVIAQLIASGKSDAEIVDHLFLSSLSRPPTGEEKSRIIAVMAEYGDDRRIAIEDAYWSLLTSTEFSFNH